jgi:hypothetical protein
MSTAYEDDRVMEMKESHIDVFFENYKFYPTLRKVVLPHVKVSLSSEKRTSKYSDELFFFQWLQEKKKVKKILKVVVDDKNHPHRDEDIEGVLGPERGPANLKSFDVEILDWRKFDICPVVIQNAAPNVRELHLQWSGKNSVLRGWSDDDGLPKLPYLQRINLCYEQVRRASWFKPFRCFQI